jgi:hypothetical protein
LKKLILILGIAVVVSLAAVAFLNYSRLQAPMSRVVAADGRNVGIRFQAHYRGYVLPTVLVLDLRAVAGTNAPIDVFRLLLGFAAAVKDQRFDRVELAYHGQTKFWLEGSYFSTLGNEYGEQNPIYTIRTFPEHLYKPDGTRAYGSWSGGVLGVLKEEFNDFSDVHRKWYIEDMARSN